MTASALVLAGSRGGEDPVAAYAGVSEKALVEVAGITMLARVMAALRGAGVTRIAVVAGCPEVLALARRLGAETIAAAAGPSESAARGLAHLGVPLLVTTADHALLRPEWVTDFVGKAMTADADVSVLLARRETIEAAAPETRRTYLEFADGSWSGCNLFYLATPKAAAAIALWKTLESDRKQGWRLVWRLGPLLLFSYFMGRLSLGDAVARLGEKAGFRGRAIESPFGLAAIDVDKPDDLDLVRELVCRPAA